MESFFDVEDLVGVTLVVAETDGETVRLVADDESEYTFSGHTDYGSEVELKFRSGSLDKLIGSPIVQGKMFQRQSGNETWTTFTIATERGGIDLHWHGKSDGYHSEEVTLTVVSPDVEEEEGIAWPKGVRCKNCYFWGGDRYRGGLGRCGNYLVNEGADFESYRSCCCCDAESYFETDGDFGCVRFQEMED